MPASRTLTEKQQAIPPIAAAAAVVTVIASLSCVQHWRDTQQRLQQLQRRGDALAADHAALGRGMPALLDERRVLADGDLVLARVNRADIAR